jgi:hypothetical protein
MAAPRSGPTAKKRPEDRLGKPRQAGGHILSEVISAPPSEFDVVSTDLVADVNWHSVAIEAWEAFCSSPLRRYHERTDYVHAWVTCSLIDSAIGDGMTAGKAMQLRMYLNDLGFTEGARRAMDMQISRQVEAPDPKKVIAKERLAAARASREA